MRNVFAPTWVVVFGFNCFVPEPFGRLLPFIEKQARIFVVDRLCAAKQAVLFGRDELSGTCVGLTPGST
jgi:hypothetical protein